MLSFSHGKRITDGQDIVIEMSQEARHLKQAIIIKAE